MLTDLFLKEVNNRNLWNFELSSRESMKIAIWIDIGFQQRNRQISQNLNTCNFCSLPVLKAQCNFRAEKYTDAGIVINYDYSQNEDVFKTLTKVDIFQLYMSYDTFRFSIIRAVDIGQTYMFSL